MLRRRAGKCSSRAATKSASLGVPVPGSVTDAELSECREGLIGMLHSLGLHAQELRPGGLLALIDELTSPTTAVGVRTELVV